MLSRIAVHVWGWLPVRLRTALTWCLNTHFIVGTVAIIEDGDGRILLARHTYKRRAPWGLPGGFVRRGEDPSETIVREIAEEVGLKVELRGPVTVQREGRRHLTIVYGGRLTGGTVRSSDEVSEARFVVPGSWPPGLREDHRVLIEDFAGSRMSR